MTQNKEQEQNKIQPEIIDKYDGKTIRIGKDGYGSRIYRISVEYVEDMMLEVNLIPLAEDGTIASSNFDWRNAESEETQRYGELYIEAIRKAKDIARQIEQEIPVDFEWTRLT